MPPADSPPRPVVLVHGIYDTSRKMQPLASYLQTQGFHPFTPTLSPSDGGLGLDQLAAQLRDFIDETIGESALFDLVGFSMGGIISRYYVQRLGGLDRVRRFVTISSPHRGTVFAWLQIKPGIRQMRPGSSFLNDLNHDVHVLQRTCFSSLWTPFDLMILPARSSQVPIGQNLTLPVLLHPWMVSQKSSLALVAEQLLR